MRFVVSIALVLSIILFSACERKYQFVSRDSNLTLNTDIEKKLSQRHLDYWEAYSQKKFDESFTFELPYLNFIKGKEWYDAFFSSNNQNYKIVQKGIKLTDKDSAIVTTKYIRKKNTYTFQDRWYRVNGTWYHWYRRSKLPKPDDK